MKKPAFAAILALFLTGNAWASNHAYPRPGFDSLVTEGQVAIGDTKIDEDGEVAAPSVIAEPSGPGVAFQGEASPPGTTFSVRLRSVYSARHSKVKKTAVMSADQNYTVQLSSSLTEGEGRSALEEFQKIKTKPVWMATAQVAGKIRYRVYYGRFKTLKEAQGARDQAAQESGVKEAFVQKIFGKLTAQNESVNDSVKSSF